MMPGFLEVEGQVKELSRSEELINGLLKSTFSQTGHEFLRALVRSAALAMNVSGVWITEYLPQRKALRAVAFWLHDHYVEDYEYAISGTPCEQVIENRCLVHYPERIIELFPEDSDLTRLNAVSYVGVPLLGPDGILLGHFSALDSKPLQLSDHLQTVFWFFAARASAELSRIQKESILRDSEQRFSQLFEGVMDAIVEVDGRFQIVRANSAAAELFGLSGQSVEGRSLAGFLTSSSAQKLYSIAQGLTECEQYSAWIPRGLQLNRSEGSPILAEASISRFDVQGQNRYSLILRNVHEQLAAEERDLVSESDEIPSGVEIAAHRPVTEIIGESSSMREVVSAIGQVAATQATVLINGETGTGKELVARAIHNASQRATKPFIRVNCAAIAASLWESEFFGHEKGAFTGAATRRLGRFELAQGGTIFLDEVGELPLELQPKLLRILQEHEYEPVGSSQTRKVDVRVLAATNRDLSSDIAAGRFREDLYYRLNVFPVTVPPLRERSGDVELLAQEFIDRLSARLRISRPSLTTDCLRRLRAYHWPGNVRELENIIERAVILAQNGTLSLRKVLPLDSLQVPRESRGQIANSKVRTKSDLREMERDTILQALEGAAWKVAGPNGAAQRLGVPPSTLASRMKSLNIRRPTRTDATSGGSRGLSRQIESNEKSIGHEEPYPYLTV
jgi:formate hydrogenlyase transcriptional activator